MKILADMHTHSIFSVDALDTIESMCYTAMQKGLKAICFTEHVDFNPNDYGYGYFELEKYIAETDKLKKKFVNQLLVLRGIEFSEPHLYKKEFQQMADYDFDVILGSIHWLNDMFVGQKELLDTYSMDEVIKRYYIMIEEALRHGGFDVLAHLDFPKRYFGVSIDISSYITNIIHLMIEKDIALEINTSTYRKGLSESMPSIALIEKYIELGGRKLTLGSDGHSCLEIAADFSKVEDMISGKYSDYVGIFSGRKFMALSELKK